MRTRIMLTINQFNLIQMEMIREKVIQKRALDDLYKICKAVRTCKNRKELLVIQSRGKNRQQQIKSSHQIIQLNILQFQLKIGMNTKNNAAQTTRKNIKKLQNEKLKHVNVMHSIKQPKCQYFVKYQKQRGKVKQLVKQLGYYQSYILMLQKQLQQKQETNNKKCCRKCSYSKKEYTNQVQQRSNLKSNEDQSELHRKNNRQISTNALQIQKQRSNGKFRQANPLSSVTIAKRKQRTQNSKLSEKSISSSGGFRKSNQKQDNMSSPYHSKASNQVQIFQYKARDKDQFDLLIQALQATKSNEQKKAIRKKIVMLKQKGQYFTE